MMLLLEMHKQFSMCAYMNVTGDVACFASQGILVFIIVILFLYSGG